MTVGPTFDPVFTSADDNKLVVPQFLTRYGLQSYFVKQRDELVELTAMDSRVLNLTRSVKYSDADRAEIQRQLPGLPEMKVEVRSLTENPPQASVIKQGSTVRGFIAGIACSVAVASALWWWQVYPVQQQLLQVNDTAQGAATVWMASPELENYERRLQQLLDTSPVQPLETGMQMMRVADSRWPESLQQQQASTQWNEALKTRAQSSPQLRGWLQTRQTYMLLQI